MKDNEKQSSSSSQGRQHYDPAKSATRSIVYTCWRCEKFWDSQTKLQQDTVRCPHCGMIHGLITSQS